MNLNFWDPKDAQNDNNANLQNPDHENYDENYKSGSYDSDDHSQTDNDNHSNQLNPNNDAYDKSRK